MLVTLHVYRLRYLVIKFCDNENAGDACGLCTAYQAAAYILRGCLPILLTHYYRDSKTFF